MRGVSGKARVARSAPSRAPAIQPAATTGGGTPAGAGIEPGTMTVTGRRYSFYTPEMSLLAEEKPFSFTGHERDWNGGVWVDARAP